MPEITMNGRHQYFVDGEKRPSVTAITGVIDKPALVSWASKITAKYLAAHIEELRKPITPDREYEIFKNARAAADVEKQAAADIGTQLHDTIKAHWLRQGVDLKVLKPEVLKTFQAFLQWESEHNLKIVAVEQMVCHSFGYAGRLDAVAECDNVLTILDWKTGGGIYAEALLQISAYALAWQDMTKQEIKAGKVIRFGKLDGKIDTFDLTFDFMLECFEAFIHAHGIYTWKNPIDKMLKDKWKENNI